MFFTKTCCVCSRELVDGERKICLHCSSAIPRWNGVSADLRAHRFPRNLPVEEVHPWLVYTNSNPVCRLIRVGKFNDRPDLIEELARRYASDLLAADALKGVDVIVPVPMHWWKRLRRGYNQAELIAREISKVSCVPSANLLKATRGHAVQSRKGGAERMSNIAGIFALSGKHDLPPGAGVAIVDDILTTGATLSEAIKTLMPLSPSKITVLTLAATPII